MRGTKGVFWTNQAYRSGGYGLLSVPSSHFISWMMPDQISGQLQAALDALVPTGCAAVAMPVGEGGALPRLSAEEDALTASWAPHRRNEFAAGRACARRALGGIGAEHACLPADEDGVPVWPVGYLGSISHSRGLAMAVAVSAGLYSLVGLDVEKTNRLSEGAMSRIVHPLEAALVGSDQVRTSILFSLKEAFYKAQFPRWRTTGNFQDLALEVDMDAGTAQILEMDARFAAELRQLRFAFRCVNDYVVSLCWR